MRNSHAGVQALAVAIVASLVVLPAVAPLAAGAGGTTVSLVPADEGIGVGETIAIQVVVDDADGGAGSAEFRVAVDDADTARVVDATVLGSGQVEKRVADDGSWIDVEYAFVDTADTGNVVIAEVIVEGVSDGTADVSLEPAAGDDAMDVYDEAGTGYSVTGTNGARLAVGGEEGGSGVSETEPTADAGSGRTTEDSGSSGDASDSDTGDDTGDSSDTSLSDSGDASSPDASSGSEVEDDVDDSPRPDDEGTPSNEAVSPAPEQSNDVEESTTFGITMGVDTLDRAAGAVGGPVVVAIAAVVLLIGIGISRRI